MVKLEEANINFSGADIVKVAKDMFKTDKPTVEQIQYVIPMLRPTNYLLEHHTVKGHPVTYSIPNYGNHNQMKYFSHRPWQRAVLNDQYQSKVIIKSRQLGFSEVGISEALWFCDTHSYDSVNALYTFPTNKQMKDFVKSRINPEFQAGYYAGIIDKYNDSLDQKSIRNSRILFRSSSKGSSMEGVDIDLLSLDEYDRLNPTAEISALESLSSSKYGLVRRWSTPTIPDYGIHKLYKESDQRKWVYRCPHCGLVQQMNYEKNIKLINPDGIDLIGRVIQDGTYQFVCQKCGKPLDRWYSGFWDITAPKAGRTHGYAISQMDAVWVTPDSLKQKELQAPNKQFFYKIIVALQSNL